MKSTIITLIALIIGCVCFNSKITTQQTPPPSSCIHYQDFDNTKYSFTFTPVCVPSDINSKYSKAYINLTITGVESQYYYACGGYFQGDQCEFTNFVTETISSGNVEYIDHVVMLNSTTDGYAGFTLSCQDDPGQECQVTVNGYICVVASEDSYDSSQSSSGW